MGKRIFRLISALCVAIMLFSAISVSASAEYSRMGNTSGVSFGLSENGVKVNADGSWSVEMYMEGATEEFDFDAWYGIYDSSVSVDKIKAERAGISQGAWGYVAPNGNKLHETALSEGDKLESGRITFTFTSKALVLAAEGKKNPTYGGTYNIFLLYTDHGEDAYTVAKTISVTIPNDPSAELMTGIDVSEYQGNIDWARVKASGVQFAILRLFSHVPDTPNYVIDAKLEQNIAGAKAQGIHIGGYFFSYVRNTDDVRKEAEMVVDLLERYPGTFDFPIVFDAEKGDTADGFDITGFAGDACEIFTDYLSEKDYYVMIYANTSWLNSVIAANKIANVDIWQAEYFNSYTGYTPSQGVSIADRRPDIKNNCNNENVYMWQYTESGTVSGIGNNCVDMNVCYRDYSKIIVGGGYNGYHVHEYKKGWSSSGHFEKCDCGEIKEGSAEKHYISLAYNGDGHWKKCECGYTEKPAAHHTISGECIYCGYEDSSYVPDEGGNGNEAESESESEKNEDTKSDKNGDELPESQSEEAPQEENGFIAFLKRLLDGVGEYFNSLFYYLNPINWFKKE